MNETVQETSVGQRNAALFVATLASFLTPFMGASLNVALPSIGRELSLSAVTLSWVATSYLLSAAVFLVPFGKIADIHGRKRIFSIGIAIYAIASLFCALAPSASILIGLRVFQGLGSAMIFGTGVAIVTSVFPAAERGRALGINVAAVYSGLSLGPFFGGFLTQHLGWRSIFWINVPLSLLILLAIIRKLKGEWAEAKGERLDIFGSVLYGISLVGLMIGFSKLASRSGQTALGAGMVVFFCFIWWEMRVHNPVLNVRLFARNRVFAFSNLAALIHYSATFAVNFVMSLYLQYIKGLSPAQAGLILIAQPVMQAVFSPFAGRLSDRVESRIVASAGMFLTVVALSFLALLDPSTTIASIVPWLLLLGFGFALFSSPNTNAVMGSVERRIYGVASATLATMRLGGQMFSMGLATLILALYIGEEQIKRANFQDFIESTRTTFALFAVLCLIGVFASLARGNQRSGAVKASP